MPSQPLLEVNNLVKHFPVRSGVLSKVRAYDGGQIRISEDDYIEGAHELVVEVASSSASYDLHTKLQVYRPEHAAFVADLQEYSGNR